MRSLHGPMRGLAFLGLAISGLLTFGGSAGNAADPFVAGGRSTRALSVAADAAAQARARGAAVGAALGLPGVPARVERLADLFDHRSYDEITFVDGHGQDVAMSRLDLDGSVAMAVTLGWRPTGGRVIDGPAASNRAVGLARSAGLAANGAPDVRRSAGAGGWSVSWQRSVHGVPVRGDGVRITLWADGSFHGLTRTERPLAVAPERTIDGSAARTAADAVVTSRIGGSPAGLAVVTTDLAWVAPNDTLGGGRLDAPAGTLRLAWVVRYGASGDLADRLRSVEAWIDAGDGRLLGGDLVE